MFSVERDKSFPRVLVGTPTSRFKDYCQDEFIKNAKGLMYPNFEFYISDNSPEKDNCKLIREKYGVNCDWVNPRGKSNVQMVAESMEQIRTKALQGNFDYLFSYESDIFGKPDIIENLMLRKKLVTAAYYHIDHGEDSQGMVILNMNISTRTLSAYESFGNHIDGDIHPCWNAGLGATLIHSSVLKQIKFRYEKKYFSHPDFFFSIDLNELKIPFYSDSSVIAEHKNRYWIYH